MADPNNLPPDVKFKKAKLETDDRFPSGPWEGFFLMSHTGRKRHMMELNLTFSETRITGEGRDFVGDFILRGRYDLESGHCLWNKKYVSKHEVGYDGYNEGKGIFGKWLINDDTPSHGGFLVWPKGMGDPTIHRRRNEEEAPVDDQQRTVTEADLATVSAESAEGLSGTLED